MFPWSVLEPAILQLTIMGESIKLACSAQAHKERTVVLVRWTRQKMYQQFIGRGA
jgi:hypothetical protein